VAPQEKPKNHVEAKHHFHCPEPPTEVFQNYHLSSFLSLEESSRGLVDIQDYPVNNASMLMSSTTDDYPH